MECASCHTALPSWAVYCHACGALQPGAAEQTEYDYAAFISYRHVPRDQQVAKEVQKAIETYRVPSGVVRKTQDGIMRGGNLRAGASLGKCFRDEDELSATHSLPDRITDALARSSALVVVCSPETPNSQWIAREIETFAQLHGRKRIFSVLAEGASAESIPDLLKSPAGTGVPSSIHGISTGPLAADLRPDATASARLEKLRIVAAVAGCDFDDLRQRAKGRRRKHVLIAALAATLALAAIAALIAFALQGARDAQISESKRLAAESRQLLGQGDRYGALETALSALPSSGNDAARPLVPEAQAALEDALEIGPNDASLWQASYSIQTEHPLSLVDDTAAHAAGEETSRASTIAVSEKGGFFAVSDDAGAITTYDIETGRKLAQCEMPADAGPIGDGLYARTMAAANDLVIVSNAGKPGVLACFEGKTGTMLWSHSGVTFPALDTSFNDGYAVMAEPNAQGGFSALVANARTGELIAPHDFAEPAKLSSSGVHTVSGKTIGETFTAFGNTLVLADLGSGRVASAALAFPYATSIGYADGTVVVATADTMPENDVWRDYAIEAFDDGLNPLWRYEGTLTSEMIADGSYVAFLAAEPAIHGFTLDDKGVAVSAGREAFVLERATGNVLFHRAYDQTVVNMRPMRNDREAYDKTFIACSDGTLTQKDLSGSALDREGDAERLVLPFPIRWARVTVQDTTATAIVLPANCDDRIVAFHADYDEEPAPDRDYSLDELIGLAHDVLAQGRG